MSFCYFFTMVDWEEQWGVHAPNFYDGKAHLSLAEFGLEGYLPLLPGPGFGDFSHPTTQLVAKMMSGMVHGCTVYDIGTGSGILALLAWRMGAIDVYGVEVSEEGLAHARCNVLLSQAPILMYSPEIFSSLARKEEVASEREQESVVLLNMIFSEQRSAYSMYPQCEQAGFLVTSGVLIEEKETYTQWLKALGREPILQNISQGWCGFVFV